MGLLIDSSCLIAVERGETDLSGLPPEARAVSVVTVSELLQGAYGPSPAGAARGLAWLERLLAAIQPLPIDEPVARVHAHLWNELKRTGSMIGAHDLWIGATALAYDLGVATRNRRDFERIPGLRVLDA